MSQMNDLTLPFIEHCIEHVLGRLRLPRRGHVEVVELSMNRPEGDGDGRIRIGRVENPVFLPRCTQPLCFLPGRTGSHLVGHLHKVEA